jgi:hypothetical protein
LQSSFRAFGSHFRGYQTVQYHAAVSKDEQSHGFNPPYAVLLDLASFRTDVLSSSGDHGLAGRSNRVRLAFNRANYVTIMPMAEGR